jgi:hypothetical protein
VTLKITAKMFRHGLTQSSVTLEKPPRRQERQDEENKK